MKATAKKPTTTLGMPARISSAGFRIFRVRRPAYSERYTAEASPIGAATSMAMAVTMRLPVIRVTTS